MASAFIEIWNLVFMQFEQVDQTTRNDLPKPSIDTGMGLERIAAVLQGKHDNYDIDLFQKLIARSEELTSTKATGELGPSHRVIADHLRSSAFLLADGVSPSNEGRGYVLRRIMRRGMRHAHLLGAQEPLLWRMVPALVEEMSGAFPELRRAEASIVEWLKLEETNFRKTLERGLRLLDDEISGLAGGAKLSGEAAFKLYDTYGFPLDLTQDALRSKGLEVDEAGFTTAMEKQKAAARQHWKGSGSASVEPIWFDLRERWGATEFLGYSGTQTEGRVLAIVKDGAVVDTARAGDEIAFIASQTTFYGESGGQMGDTGEAVGAHVRVEITDTAKRLGDLYVHLGKVIEGELEPGITVNLVVDTARRDSLRRAHSATHLLHAALRGRLGDHVAQKGSLVAPDRLRFDFSQPRAMSRDDIKAVEAEVNSFVRQNDDVSIRVMDREGAIEAGAMALFGEKYGDEVRVVAMGKAADASTYSLELCGGTHVGRTGDIALVKLVGESAVASGVRRVEALTGDAALEQIERDQDTLMRAAELLKVTAADLPQRLEALLEERRKLVDELAEARRKLATGEHGDAGPKMVGNIAFSGRVVEGLPAKELRGLRTP